MLVFILFVCEDNGIGILVKILEGWIVVSFGYWLGLDYFFVDGLDLVNGYDVV